VSSSTPDPKPLSSYRISSISISGVFEQQWRRMAAAGQPHHEPVVTLGEGAEHHRAEAGCLGDRVIIAHASDVIAGGGIHRFIVAYAGSCGTIVANMLVWQAFSHAV
jgi:hypothetical protein